MELKVEKKIEESEVNEIVKETSKLTDDRIEASLNYDSLTQAEKDAIDEFNKKIDVTDSTQVLQFGNAAQNKISQFSDSVLDDVRTKNLGEVGNLLADLVGQIKSFNSDISNDNKGFLAKLFSRGKQEIDTIIAKYNKIDGNIDTIEKSLEKHRLQMLKDINMFDDMYDKNLTYFKELSLYIIAGDRKLNELKTVDLPALIKKAEESGEQMDAQRVKDLESVINRFEKKVYDLKTTRIISIQMAPQIRLLQSSEAELVDKIQSSITNTIPLWKNQMVIALGINNAKQALGAQTAVTNLTNDMLKQNSEILKQGSIEVAEQSERAIVDVETLQKTNNDLIETLDKVIEIHKQGRVKRQEGEKALEEIEKELKSKMLEIKNDNTVQSNNIKL
ncbi:MAG: toxic anion resistance protein [Clostridia bacterium]|nr:toxic anion resistance protein [Clostridia bacterium]